MLEKIILTVTSFSLFIYILLFKLIKKNDTTYLLILAMETVGILINLLQLVGLFSNLGFTSAIYLFCIIIPILVTLLELKKVNVSTLITLSIAQIYLWLNKQGKAKEILIATLEKYEYSYRGHKMLAQIYEAEGGMRKAIDEYVKVLDINGKDYEAYYRISILLNELGKKDEAIEMLKNLLSVRPNIYEAISLLGELYLEKENYQKVIKVYTKSLKFNPDKQETYYNLGIAYSMINDFETAKKCFERAVELNEDCYKAYYKLGQIALLYRDFDLAEKNFLKSVYNEKEARAYVELAKISMIKNRKEKSVLYLNNAMNVDSSYYKIIKEEPMFFSIKNFIEKPKKEIKNENRETEREQKIEEYLSNTLELVQVLNEKENKNFSQQYRRNKWEENPHFCNKKNNKK